MNTACRFDQITKRFGRKAALENVTLQIPSGIVCALLGENGAGKTTALRILLGLLEPTAGSSEVLGMCSQTQGQAIRRQVGYVPDRPTFYEWMTVSEIGWFAAGFSKSSFLPSYFDLLRKFHLDPDVKLKQLSKGLLARVSLALALAADPALLVLDEPTSGLDPVARRDFLEGMAEVAATGRTVLLSSHQLHEVERVADRVVIVHDGRFVLCEDVERLKSEIVEWTVTLRDGPHSLPPFEAGEILHRRNLERQCRLLVRGVDESHLAWLRRFEGVRDVVARMPTLEDIYLAYTQESDEPATVGANGGARHS